MTLPIPLTVRLWNANVDRHIEREIRDLSFRCVVPGGFASASLPLDRPLSATAPECAYYTRCAIYGRNGKPVFQGRLEDPARSAGSDGQVWDLAVVGPSAHVQDRTIPLIYVDTTLDHFFATAGGQSNGEFSTSERTEGANQLHLEGPEGKTITATAVVIVTSYRVRTAAQSLARVNFQMVGGSGSANWNMEAYAVLGGQDTIRTATLTAVVQGLSAKLLGTDWTHPRDRVAFELRRNSTADGNPAVANRWAEFFDVRIRPTMYNAAGTEQTSAGFYTADTVLASEVVADLLGRLLNQYDGTNASITTTSNAIDQLAFPDGVNAGDVLDTLMGIENTFYWAAWEGDLARFEWRAWPTAVTYEASAADGYDSVASTVDLFNALTVLYTDDNGRERSTRLTQTVPELDDNGLTREAVIQLPDSRTSSVITAGFFGNSFLAEHAMPRNAGKLTIARPILNRDTGIVEQPWEVRPGKLIRVRDIQPSAASLSATGRDGVSVFRMISTEFHASSGTVDVELDSPSPSITRLVAVLAPQIRKSTPITPRRAQFSPFPGF